MSSKPQHNYFRISLAVAPPLVGIRLQNPPHNVIDIPTMDELRLALSHVESMPDVSTIVISGSERVFSAGVDIAAHTRDQVRDMLAKFHEVIRTLQATQKVTVAIVHGNCFGGGAEIALACDLVYTSENATWQFPEIKLGCFPPVAMACLASIIGQKAASDLILTGRSINGLEAQRLGLATECALDNQIDGRAEAAIGRLMALSPAVLKIAKKTLHASFTEAAHFGQALARAEQVYINELIQTHDAEEGIRAFLDKRAPRWTGK